MSKNTYRIMEQMNIIFIHKGNSWYLPYALNQVKKSNPNANIILLGDESNNKYPFIKHFLISDYSKTADSFALIYKHFSTTNYQHELFCIQRWFIWLEFMQAHNLNSAMFPDTDVLIFQDIQNFILSVPRDNYYYSKGTTNYMGFVYFKDVDYLKQVCNYITDTYSNSLSLSKLDIVYKKWVAEHGIGGVSDITLFDNFEYEYPNSVVNFETPPIINKAFVNSLEANQYKLNKKGYVDISWKKNTPFATLTTGEKVSVMGIHCFGSQKPYIRKLYKGKNWFAARTVYCWKISVFKMLFDIIRGRR